MYSPNRKNNWTLFIGYGAGDYGLNLFWQSIGFFLFYFYTDVVGVSSALVGTIFLIGSIWDAVSDPAMGYLAERTKSRFGPYRPYLAYGAIPLGLSFGLLFTPIRFENSSAQFLYLLTVLLLFRTCYTVVSIPYATLGARITQDSDARTRLAGIRMYCGFLGGLSISFFAKFLQETRHEESAFSLMGYVAGAVGILALLACFKTTQNTHEAVVSKGNSASLGHSLKAIFGNRPFLLLVGGIMLVTVANTVVGQSVLYFFESQFGSRNLGNTAIVIMTGAPLVSIPFWATIALRVGKRNAWIAGSLTATLGLALLFFEINESETLALWAMVITTLGLSSYAVIFWSMLPDTIEYGEFKSMVQNESLLIGIASSFQKISIGLSAFILGILLSLIGYDPNTETSERTADGILHIFTLIPISALLMSSVLILFYPITAKLHGEILEALRDRSK